MKRLIFILLLGASLSGIHAWRSAARLREENRRLRRNSEVLADSVRYYTTLAGRHAAAAEKLTLRCDEFRRLREADAERIRRMGIRIRRLESSAVSVAATAAETAAPLHDTVVVRDTVRDTVRLFSWRDAWVEVRGIIRRDSAECSIRSVDTLHQIVHRVPRRFLFFRFGTKAVRQEIVSTNPHTRIVYTDYVELKRRRR